VKQREKEEEEEEEEEKKQQTITCLSYFIHLFSRPIHAGIEPCYFIIVSN
jgi:hypothetical protein